MSEDARYKFVGGMTFNERAEALQAIVLGDREVSPDMQELVARHCASKLREIDRGIEQALFGEPRAVFKHVETGWREGEGFYREPK